MDYTPAQQAAMATHDRHLQIIACAGSGKTQVISARIVELLRAGAPPASIVAFTFTERAAGELKERIYRLCREGLESDRGLAELYVGTIHGYCLRLLQSPPLYRFLEYSVLSDIRQRLFLDRYSAQTGLTRTPLLDGSGTLRRYLDTRLYQQVLSILEEGDVDRSRVPTGVLEATAGYHVLCEHKRYLDYTTIMAHALDQLRGHAGLRAQLAQQVRYLVVDEYQDVNPLQERIIAELATLGANVCVVGDDDQVLYQWRGSDVGNMLTFTQRYPNVAHVTLNENFRSSAGVVATARSVIERNRERLPKAMSAVDAQPDEPGDLVALGFASVGAEAAWIADTIRHLHGTTYRDRPNGPTRGLTYSDCAVLLRSVRHDAGPILAAFDAAGIPYLVGGRAGLFETAEALALRAAFAYLAGHADADAERETGEAVPLQAVQVALREAALGLDARHLEAGMRLLMERRRLIAAGPRDPALALQQVYHDLLAALAPREEAIDRARGTGREAARWGEVVFYNLGKFSQVIADFEHIYYDAAPPELYRAFARFLTHEAPETYAEGGEEADVEALDAVPVMTVHQAKGLQWPAVFIPALRRNRFPSPKMGGRSVWHVIPEAAVRHAERYKGSLEDERRLFYVALTRAEKHLACTWAPHPTIARQGEASPFLAEWTATGLVHEQMTPSSPTRTRTQPQPRRTARTLEVSFSDLKDYFVCPYRFKLRFLYGFTLPISVGMGYGRALHNALAEIHAEAIHGHLLTLADVPRLVDAHLHLPFAPPDKLEQQRARARRVLTRYLQNHRRDLTRLEHAEKPIEIEADQGLTVRGRIDLIQRTDTGAVVIVDFKSGERTPDEAVTPHQLRIYAAGYHELTGKLPDHIEVHELERGMVHRVPISARLIQETLAEVARAGQALRANDLPPLARWGDTCVKCALRGICRDEPRGLFTRLFGRVGLA